MSIQEYLDLCKNDPMAYASVAERMLTAIGEPELVDTRTIRAVAHLRQQDDRSIPPSAISTAWKKSSNRSCPTSATPRRVWKRRKQILYLLGPVGGGKSSLAEKLKHLIEKIPIYAIKGSPVHESPLGLFNPIEDDAHAGRRLRHSAALPQHHHEPVGGQAPARIRWRHHQFRVVKR